MNSAHVFDACKAELEASGQLKALRCIQSLEARLSGSAQPIRPPKKTFTFVACTLCRRSKAKCVISQEGASQCDRCRVVGCQCVYEKHKRGRKPTRGLDMPRALQGEEPPGSSRHSQSPQNGINPEASPSSLRLLRDAEMNPSDDDVDVIQPPITHSAAHPLPFISGSHRPFTIQSMLNPLMPAPDGTSFNEYEITDEAGASPTGFGAVGDPVSRNIVSLGMAQQLFAFFFEKLNPIIMLFDPSLHTFDYIRQKSSFLFSAIISSSAKFVAPDFVRSLSQMAMDYSLRAILVSGRGIETIQGWMVIYFWKAPRDNRAWMYVGLACRMGVELGLDCTPTHDLPNASELDQRERRNRQRTWMLAFMMDRAMASATGRDWMVRGHDAVVRNNRVFSDHRFRVPGDAVVGGFTELRLISSEAIDILYPGVAAASSRVEIDVTRELLRVNYDLKLWLQYWTTETERFNQPPIYLALLCLFGLHVQLTLNSFAIPRANSIAPSLRGLPCMETQTPERYCYDLAIQNLKQLRVIHDLDEGILRYMQDSISIMVAYAACFLRKVINESQFEDAERHSAILLIADTSRMFREVTFSPLDTASLQAQFLQSLAELPHHAGVRPSADLASPQQVHLSYLDPHVSNGVTGNGSTNMMQLGNPNGVVVDNLAMGIPQSVADIDLSGLDGATWDQIMADWMANPDSGSLQYKNFVSNFASSEFVDVQQHSVTEFAEQLYYG